jgi:hypothetical protein
MRSYLSQMQDAAERKGIPLREAVIACGLPDSNYYRWKAGVEPQARTVRRVLDFLAQQVSEDTEQR